MKIEFQTMCGIKTISQESPIIITLEKGGWVMTEEGWLVLNLIIVIVGLIYLFS